MKKIVYFAVLAASQGMAQTPSPSSPLPPRDTAERTALLPENSSKKSYLEHPFIKTLMATYMTNPSLRAKAKEQYIQAEKVTQAKAGWRPNVSASGSLGHQYNDAQAQNQYNRKSTTYSSPITGGINLNQALYASQTGAQIDQAKAKAFAGMADFSKTEQDTLVEAANAFLTVWLKGAVFTLREKNVVLKTATLEQVKARANVGELTLTDVAQAAGEQANAFATKTAAAAELATARATYLRIVGEAPPHDMTPPHYLMSHFPIPPTLEAVIQLALKNNPSIQKASYDVKFGEAGLDLAKAGFKPTVQLDIDGQQGLHSSNPDSRGRSASLKLNLKMPLYQGGSEYSKYREARQNHTQSKLALAQVRTQIIEAATQAWEKWDSSKNQIEQTKVQIKAQALSLEGVRQEFMVGEKTTRDVLDAENKLVEAETNLVNAEQTYFLATYQILSVIGHMTAKQLALPVELYPIQAHYDKTNDKWIGFGDYSER